MGGMASATLRAKVGNDKLGRYSSSEDLGGNGGDDGDGGYIGDVSTNGNTPAANVLLSYLNVDGTGTTTMERFKAVFVETKTGPFAERVMKHSQANAMWRVMDADASGAVALSECMRVVLGDPDVVRVMGKAGLLGGSGGGGGGGGKKPTGSHALPAHTAAATAGLATGVVAAAQGAYDALIAAPRVAATAGDHDGGGRDFGGGGDGRGCGGGGGMDGIGGAWNDTEAGPASAAMAAGWLGGTDVAHRLGCQVQVACYALCAALVSIAGHNTQGYDRVESQDEVRWAVTRHLHLRALGASAIPPGRTVLQQFFSVGTTTAEGTATGDAAMPSPRPYPGLSMAESTKDVGQVWRLFHPTDGTSPPLCVVMVAIPLPDAVVMDVVKDADAFWGGGDNAAGAARSLVVSAVRRDGARRYTLTVANPCGQRQRRGTWPTRQMAFRDVAVRCSSVEFIRVVVAGRRLGAAEAQQRFDDSWSPTQFSNVRMYVHGVHPRRAARASPGRALTPHPPPPPQLYPQSAAPWL